MNTNNKISKMIKKIITIISFLVLLISFFPMIVRVIHLYRDRNLIFESQYYKKVNIEIDSLDSNTDGNANFVYAYSKELDNYKTEIIFGTITDENYDKIINYDKNKKLIKNVWYKKGEKFAYPYYTNYDIFPIYEFVFNSSKLIIIWIISLFLFKYFYKLSKKQ